MFRYLILSLSLLAIDSLHAQCTWISFADSTSTNLVLTTQFQNDTEEKDLGQGDLDKDGWTDVFVARKMPFSTAGPRANLLLMNINGVLTDQTATYCPDCLNDLTDTRDVLIMDMDGDTWLDIILCNTFGDEPNFIRNLGNDVNGNWLGMVDESLTRFPPVSANPIQFCAVWGGDINGDTYPDLYFVNYNPGTGSDDVLLINDGTGVFTDESASRLGNLRRSAFGTSVEIHDMDMDGDNDIVKTSTLYNVAPWNDLGVFVLFNDGTGNFTNWQMLDSSSPYMFTCGEIDSNPGLDVYIIDDAQDYVDYITAMNPDTSVTHTRANLTTAASPRTTGFGGNIHAADLDNDGDLDFGISSVDVDIPPCENARKFTMLENTGQQTGVLVDPWPISEVNVWNESTHDFLFLDVNNDGLMDVLQARCGGLAVLFQAPPGSCNLADVTVGTQSTPVDDMFDQELVITYCNEPVTGDLMVNGQMFPITGSPQTVTLSDILITNNDPIDVTVSFTASTACTGNYAELFFPPCATLNLPYSTDFENGGDLPPCWELSSSTGKPWNVDTTTLNTGSGQHGAAGDHTSGAGYFAWVDDSNNEGGEASDVTLTSPAFNLGTMINPELRFWFHSVPSLATAPLVTTSLDFWDGASWNTGVWSFSGDNGGWTEYVVDLSVYTITGPIQFRWINDNANGDFRNDVGLDDVSVLGEDPFIALDIKTFLKGPYDDATGLMRDDLRTALYIPIQEPYAAIGFTHQGSGGGEEVDPTVLFNSGDDAIVDWVFVELRDDIDNTVVLETKSALLQRDGDIVDLDGVSSLSFPTADGDYFVSVRHRNHLPVCTRNVVTLSDDPTLVDFTDPTTQTFGVNATEDIGGTMVMWSGNCIPDDAVKYVGAANDRDMILIRIGGSIPTNTAIGYEMGDVTMDGIVKYVGSDNDRDAILINIGGSIPTNSLLEQLP